jgi:hypothetical protein
VPVGVVLCGSVVFGPALLNVLMEKWLFLFTAVLPQLVLLILFFIVSAVVAALVVVYIRGRLSYEPERESQPVAAAP